MNKYDIVYSDYNKQIWVLILFPLLMITPLVVVLTSVKEISESVILISVIVWMGLMIITMIYVVSKQLMVPATIIISEGGLKIYPAKKTLFYGFNNLFIPFNNIKSVTDDEDVQQNYRKFFTLKIKKPAKKIMLLAPKKQLSADTQQCALAIHTAIKNYNQSPAASVAGIIKEGSFYTSIFAKVITVLFIAVIVAVIVVKVWDPESVPWYRMVALFSFAFLWFANFFNAAKKEKQNRNN